MLPGTLCPGARRFDTTHELRHRLMGEAPHLMDPEELDAALLLEDGRQRGLYELPPSAGRARSPLSTAEFTDSIFEVLPDTRLRCQLPQKKFGVVTVDPALVDGALRCTL